MDNDGDLEIVSRPGNYAAALQCYEAAKGWVLDNGLAFLSNVKGQIGRPRHDEHPDENVGIVPPELIDRPGWTVTISFWSADYDALCKIADLKLHPLFSHIGFIKRSGHAARYRAALGTLIEACEESLAAALEGGVAQDLEFEDGH